MKYLTFGAIGKTIGLACAPIVLSCTVTWAQTAAEDLRACISAGAPLYQVSSVRHNETDLQSAFYSKFCKVQHDWGSLNKEDQEGVRTSWLGPYGDFAGDWSKSGTVSSEEEHYKASCDTLEQKFHGVTITSEQIYDIRGNVDQLIQACQIANFDGVRMVPQIPGEPSGFLVLNFSTQLADRAIKGVATANLDCELDGVTVNGNLTQPREFTNNAAQIVCRRSHRPISVYGASGDYYPPSEIVVSTDYAQEAPKIALLEEVDGVLRTRLATLEDRMNPVGTIIELEPGKPCPANWTLYTSGQGRMLIGAVAGNPSSGGTGGFTEGSTGGAIMHQLTIPEMPKHDHGGDRYMRYAYGGNGAFGSGANQFSQPSIAAQGEDKPFDILPPYLAVTRCVKQ